MIEGILAESDTEPVPSDGNVVALHPGTRRERRVAGLSDREIIRLRRMLDDFDRVKRLCPLAQRAISQD